MAALLVGQYDQRLISEWATNRFPYVEDPTNTATIENLVKDTEIQTLIYRNSDLDADFLRRLEIESQKKLTILNVLDPSFIDLFSSSGLEKEVILSSNYNATCEAIFHHMLTMDKIFPKNVNKDDHRNELVKKGLFGRTLGLIGITAYSTKLATIANSFGMKVIAFDFNQNELLPFYLPDQNIEPRDDIKSVIAESDFVSLHLLEEGHVHVINMEAFSNFDPTRKICIINTSSAHLYTDKLDDLFNKFPNLFITQDFNALTSSELNSIPDVDRIYVTRDLRDYNYESENYIYERLSQRFIPRPQLKAATVSYLLTINTSQSSTLVFSNFNKYVGVPCQATLVTIAPVRAIYGISFTITSTMSTSSTFTNGIKQLQSIYSIPNCVLTAK